jgi:hypothetical protein
MIKKKISAPSSYSCQWTSCHLLLGEGSVVKECAVNNHSSWVMSQASHSSKVQGNSHQLSPWDGAQHEGAGRGAVCMQQLGNRQIR